MKTLWGVTPLQGNCPEGYTALFARIAAAGFSAVETPVWQIADKAAFSSALAATGLRYVAMLNTCTPDPAGPPGSTLPVMVRTLEAHVASFRAQLTEAVALNPLLVNSHSGCDSWGAHTARAFFTAAFEAEAELAGGVLVCHETHRGRILYNPWITRDLVG